MLYFVINKYKTRYLYLILINPNIKNFYYYQIEYDEAMKYCNKYIEVSAKKKKEKKNLKDQTMNEKFWMERNERNLE